MLNQLVNTDLAVAFTYRVTKNIVYQNGPEIGFHKDENVFRFELGGVLGDIFHKNVYGQEFLYVRLYLLNIVVCVYVSV